MFVRSATVRVRRKSEQDNTRNPSWQKLSRHSNGGSNNSASQAFKRNSSYKCFDMDNHINSVIISSYLLNRGKVAIVVRRARFETFESTLANFPNTLLGNVKKRKHHFNREMGAYFFNRCVESFDAVLFYYQSKGILAKPALVEREPFYHELAFYQIDEYIDERHFDDMHFMNSYYRRRSPRPNDKLRSKIWQYVQFYSLNNLQRVYTYFNICLTVLSIAAYCLETVSGIMDGKAWLALETFFTVFFVLELTLNIYATPCLRQLLKLPLCWVDISSVVFSLFHIALEYLAPQIDTLGLVWNVAKFARVVRVFKLCKFSLAFRLFLFTLLKCSQNLQVLMVSILTFCFAFAATVFQLELQFNPSPHNRFVNIFESSWYVIITATGVGYGDIYPTTSWGKIVGSFLAVTGLLLFCLPQPMLVNQFISTYYLPETMSKENTVRKRAIMKMRQTFLEQM